jgi:DNA repair photolyase
MDEASVHVAKVSRAGPVLTPSSLACLRHVPTVNLAAGCAHECLYCYARGYSQSPGQNRVQIYANTLQRLREELPRTRRRPPAVYFSPSSDAFQPVPEVLDLAYDVFDYLLSQCVGISLLTKGHIPARHMELLTAHAPLVHAGIGLNTLGERISRLFEPGAASPDARLAQAAALVRAGIAVQVRLDPILPGVTDDERTLREVLGAVADAGVRHVAISTAFMRPAIASVLRGQLEAPLANALLRHYGNGCRLTMAGAETGIVMPPVATRRTIYDRARRIADRHGLEVRICACKNSDLADGSCRIAGPAAFWQHSHVQGELFGACEAERREQLVRETTSGVR